MKTTMKLILILSITIMILTTQLYSYNLNDSLIAYFKFEDTSDTIVYDSSGNNLIGINYGCTYELGHPNNGYCMYFDGSSHLEITDDPLLDITGDLTMICYVNPQAITYVNPILSKGIDGNDYGYFLATGTAYSEGSVNLQLHEDGTEHIWLDSEEKLIVDEWYHIAAVRRDSMAYIYINGILDTSLTCFTTSLRTCDNPLYIGQHYGSRFFNGYIDEVRIYNRALSDEEIIELYGQCTPMNVNFDIMPGVYPNYIDVDLFDDGKKVSDLKNLSFAKPIPDNNVNNIINLEAAIMGSSFGTDVTTIDLNSIRINGHYPARCRLHNYAHTPDLDIAIDFNVLDILTDVAVGESYTLSVTGDFNDGQVFIGHDYLIVVDDPPLSMREVPNNVPATYALHQNYPNPFNPTTTISFSLKEASDYNLAIYNITGQEVETFNGHGESGMHEIQWDASHVASGIYLYKLEAGSFSDTKKMILLK